MKNEAENMSEKFLKTLDNNGGFTVPVRFFEDNKTSILGKINKPKSNLFSIANWQFISGIAAIFIAIVVLFVFINNKENNKLNANLNKISDAEMIDFLATNDVKVEWINEINVSTKTISKKEENNKEIEQYLLEQADEQALLEEL